MMEEGTWVLGARLLRKRERNENKTNRHKSKDPGHERMNRQMVMEVLKEQWRQRDRRGREIKTQAST